METLADGLIVLFAFAFGAIVGSFANVCIHRLPRFESIVSPPSRCPGCGGRIRPFDNIPVLSWLLLRGRCRACGIPISPRYPIVEAVTGLAFAASVLRYGISPQAAALSLLSAASVILIGTDLSHRVLPEEITRGALGLGLLLAALRDTLLRPEGVPFRLSESHFAYAALGAALGGLGLLAFSSAYRALRGRDGLGLGDIEMLAMVGGIMGPWGVFLTVLFSSLAGSLVGVGFALWNVWRWRAARSAFQNAAPRENTARLADLVVDLAAAGTDTVAACGSRWSEIPGAALAGQPLGSAAGLARRVAAVVRMARRRARHGQPEMAYGPLRLEQDPAEAPLREDFFRIVTVRSVVLGQRLYVRLSRADIPYGVFLALGSVTAFLVGRAALAALFGGFPLPGDLLLP